MGAQRYVLLFSFIVAAILTPTPDPINQLIMAAPAVMMYQVAILLVWLVNRKKPAQQNFKYDDQALDEIAANFELELPANQALYSKPPSIKKQYADIITSKIAQPEPEYKGYQSRQPGYERRPVMVSPPSRPGRMIDVLLN